MLVIEWVIGGDLVVIQITGLLAYLNGESLCARGRVETATITVHGI